MPDMGENIPLFNMTGSAVETARCYSHTAMATLFQIYVIHPETSYGEQAAWDAFDKVDQLEQEFSRFLPNSDISRINALPKNGTISISVDTFACLQVCKQLYEMTFGAFDITIGNLYEIWLDDDKSLKNPSMRDINEAKDSTGMQYIRLDSRNLNLTNLGHNIHLDLGGVGKGFALDRIKDVLQDWEIKTALIHAGYSSVLALGKPFQLDGWPVTISDPRDGANLLATLFLKNIALSGSGIIKGRHIIDPEEGKPVNNRIAAWTRGDTAAICDGASTALMVMNDEEIERFHNSHPEISFLLCNRKNRVNSKSPLSEIKNYSFLDDSIQQ
jgi:FAD:protein FMN transferase